MQSKIKLFQSKKLRKHWDEVQGKWFFPVIDVLAVLTDNPNPKKYWSVLKNRLKQQGSQLPALCSQKQMVSSDGIIYTTDVADTEQLLRLIQSIPSQSVEPYKQWLAKVGYERIKEIEDPEIAQDRIKFMYEKKGYPQEWIDKRLRGMAVRQNLTDEWKERGIQSKEEYRVLTNEISKATFGLTPSEYREIKGLTQKTQNLRDHMTDFELIFAMLGEKVTTEISKMEKPDTFKKSKKVAKRGGKVAGNARRRTEKELGKSIITNENSLVLAKP